MDYRSDQKCAACDEARRAYSVQDIYAAELQHNLRVKNYWGENTVTPEELYQSGYDDGKAGKAANASHVNDSNYAMGYEDGKGDRAIERPVEATYVDFNEPPTGFVFAEEKRVPEPGEWYLSKNGNAIQAKKVRGNNQTRHILLPD